MNCWEILGIEPGADKKTIKFAYSKILKTSRPDEDPEGFQRLHSAYRSALEAANNSHAPPPSGRESCDLDSSLADEINAHTETDTGFPPKPAIDIPDSTAIDASGNPQQGGSDDELEEEWYRFSSLVNDILQDQQRANEAGSWENVVGSSLVTDLLFKDSASDYVFDAISRKNVLALENGALYVETSTLNHLNDFFSWGINWGQLDGKFSESRLDAVLPFLNEEKKYEIPQEPQPHIYSRLTGHATSFLAIIAGYTQVNLFIATAILAIPSTINRVYTRKWQTKNYGRAVGGEDDLVESEQYGLYATLFLAMWIVMVAGYGIGWVINYLVNLVLA